MYEPYEPTWTPTSPPASTTASATTFAPRPTAPPSFSPPPTHTRPSPEPTPPRRSGFGRVILAFVAGATISAGSFALGASSSDGDPALTAAPTIAPAVSQTTPAAPIDPQPAPIPSTGDPVADVAAALGPSVVQIETDLGLGSGVVYEDGRILTNHHVIDGAGQIRVRTSDGRTFDATLLGSDPRNDIAVLDIGEGSGVPIASLADEPLAVGQLAVAIGSPFQLQQTVTAGIVSAVNRPVPNLDGGFNAMIQTDAPINPGNSGGALADRNGQVIGINSSIRTDGNGNGNVGIGFALPIQTALDVADRITSGAPLDVGVLGIANATEDDNEVGVIIGEIVPGGAAETAGLLPGDRLTTIDGAPVTNFGEVVGLVQSHFVGDTIELTVVRGGENLTLAATLN